MKDDAKAVIVRAINTLSDQLAAAIAEREEAQRERAAIDTSSTDATRIADHIRYLAGSRANALRWSKANKQRALEALFGDDPSLRRKKDVGIYVDPKTGALALHTVFALSALAAKVEPGEALGRPYRKQIDALAPHLACVLPTTRTSTRCRCRSGAAGP